MFLRRQNRWMKRSIAPAFFAGVVLLSVVSCGKNIDNSVRQLQIDREEIGQYLENHCLTPSGEIIPLSEVPAPTAGEESGEQAPALPEGYALLKDTAQATGNMYVIPLKEGAGNTPAGTNKVLIRYAGYYMESMQEFDSTWDDPDPYALWMAGAIEGFRNGLLKMKTGVIDPNQPNRYVDPGEAWLIIPSTMAFGQEGKTDPTVPPNTCLAYRVILYGIVVQNN